MILAHSFKPKACDICGKSFIPMKAMQRVCGLACAKKVPKVLKAKASKELRERKIRDKERLLELDPKKLKEAAQREFNTYIRLRDAKLPCISCGKEPEPWKFHGGRDAGHWRTVKAAGHLRYHEDNVHAQCVHCNQWEAGNATAYRARLIERIGLERVEALESDNAVKRWTTEELKAIRDKYRELSKQLKKENE